MVEPRRLTPPETGFIAAFADLPADYVMQMHAHEDHEINVILRGGGHYRFPDGKELAFQAGEIVLLPADTGHRIHPRGPMEMRILLVHPEIFSTALADLPEAEPWRGGAGEDAAALPARVRIAPAAARSLLEIGGQADAEEIEGGHLRTAVLRHLAALTGLHLLRLWARETPAARPSPAHLRVLGVKDRIDREFVRPWRLEELAEAAALSPSHFCALFRELVGCAPKTYLRRRRLEHAKRLLVETDFSVLEIALAAGFADPSPFDRAFKRAHGLTPSSFRKKRQSNRPMRRDRPRPGQ